MQEPNEFDLESQEWVTLKSHEELEKEVSLLKEKLENEKKEKEALKKDVNSYLTKTVETLKQADLVILDTEKIKAETEAQEKILQKKIKRTTQQHKNQKKREKKQKKIRKKLENEISKNETLEKEMASLKSAVILKDIELERMLTKRDEEIKEKNNEIRTLTDTLSQKEEEITKLHQMLNEKKPYATVTKLWNFTHAPTPNPSQTQLKNR